MNIFGICPRFSRLPELVQKQKQTESFWDGGNSTFLHHQCFNSINKGLLDFMNRIKVTMVNLEQSSDHILMSIWMFNWATQISSSITNYYSNFILNDGNNSESQFITWARHLSFCFGIFCCFPGRGATGPTGRNVQRVVTRPISEGSQSLLTR